MRLRPVCRSVAKDHTLFDRAFSGARFTGIASSWVAQAKWKI